MVMSLAFFIASIGSGNAAIELCNRGEHPLRFAIVGQAGLMGLSDKWEAAGWYVLEKGCMNVVPATQVLTHAFLSIQTMYEHIGYKINHYELVEVDSDGGSGGTERFFCVRSDDFSRTTRGIDAQATCPDGYYLQLFNLYIFTPSSLGRYTVDLN
jgi:hypothetical protein